MRTNSRFDPIDCPSCGGDRVRRGPLGPVICRTCHGEGRVPPPAFAHPASDSLDDVAELDRELAALDARAEASCC
jgi:ribosomal protein L37AE/L43A